MLVIHQKVSYRRYHGYHGQGYLPMFKYLDWCFVRQTNMAVADMGFVTSSTRIAPWQQNTIPQKRHITTAPVHCSAVAPQHTNTILQ